MRKSNKDPFKAVADPCRRRILTLLAHSDLPLHRISTHFKMSRPAIIKHMRVLKSCGLVKTQKQGRATIHRFDAAPLRDLSDWVSRLSSLWGDHLEKLKQQVESK